MKIALLTLAVLSLMIVPAMADVIPEPLNPLPDEPPEQPDIPEIPDSPEANQTDVLEPEPQSIQSVDDSGPLLIAGAVVAAVAVASFFILTKIRK
jgi:hypothetical protein